MLEDITAALNSIHERGTFASRETASHEDLSIEVKDVGKIRLPVSATTARKLRRAGRQAGFGWRDKTLLDKSVRDTWEIARSKVKIDQRRWKKVLEPQLEKIKHKLGLPAEGKLVARLHKMLVYEAGQFFVPHRDSEKTADMVATLSVVLPSAYKGGSVVIEHRGETVTFRRSAERLTFIAFYADCHHEVRPVTEGYRVVLEYNLMFDGPAITSPGPSDEQSTDRLAEHVSAHFTTPVAISQYSDRMEGPPDKLVYLLDHDYTTKSLGWDQLKNGDRLRAAALLEVAERLDCESFLALADVHESWSCEDDDYGWGYGGYRRYRDYDEEEDPDSFTLTELFESEIELRHWIDVSSKVVKSLQVGVSWNEVCYTRATVELEPFKSEHEGWMGNYGNTVDRWYHRATVIMWPRRKAFEIRAKVSPAWAIEQLTKSVKAGSLSQAREKARSLVPFWQRRASREETKPFLEKTLRVASGLGDRELAASLLAPFRLHQLGQRAMPHFVALLESYGLAWCRARLLQWEAGDNHPHGDRVTAWLQFMPTFCRKLCDSGAELGRELAQWLVAHQWTLTKDSIERHLEDRERPHALERLTAIARDMIYVLESCVAADGRDVHASIEAFVTSNETNYPVVCLVAALRDSRKRHTPKDLRALGLGAVRDHCVDRLTAALAAPARSADNWSITPPMKCGCELCGALGQFLTNRDQTRLEWPLAKDKRAHIHRQLDGYVLPVSHTTKRTGRPYSLVLIKTKTLFEREAELRKSLKRELTWLNQQRRAFG